MNRSICLILLCICVFYGCRNNKDRYDPGTKTISKEQALLDFDAFDNILKDGHPSLNIYIGKNRFSFLTDSIKASINSDIPIREFFNKLFFITNEIGCSHTDLALPDHIYDTLDNRKFFFPFPVSWIDGRLIVNATGTELPQGTEVKKINGEPIKKVINGLMMYNSVEGRHRITQQLLAANNFATLYYLKYGGQKEFELQLIDTLGKESTENIAPVTLGEYKKRRQEQSFYFNNTELDHDLYINSKYKYAYLRLKTFSFATDKKEDGYENFLSNSFELLKYRKDVSSLIIDLRENGGGTLYNAFLLYSYITKSKFKEFEKVSSRMAHLPYPHYLDQDFAHDYKMDINETLSQEFTGRSKGNSFFIPDSLIGRWEPDKNHFSGKVFVLTDYNVASAASYFCTMVKNSGAGKIIGETAIGGSYSGNGYKTLEYVLPYSKIKLYFPYAHLLYTYKDGKNTGLGLTPDYFIPDNYNSFKNNSDRQMDFVIDSLILN